jgi:ABC-type Fe3+ transport system permease subunit
LSPLKIAAAVAGAALFTLICMWLGLRVAGPQSHAYNLGSVELSVAPSLSGKAKVYIPLAGWEIEAPVVSAPYAVHAQPRHVSPSAIKRAAHGVKQTLKTTKRELKHAAIVTLIRAFLFALLGALAAGAVLMLLLRALRYGWRTSLLAGAACLGFGAIVVAASGLWLWQSLDIKAFKRAKITLGSGRVLVRSVERFRNDSKVNTIIEDLSNLVAKGDRNKR